jgi:hypothetical protein
MELTLPLGCKDLTLPLEGSRGTSREGLLFQVHPLRTILPGGT